MQRQVEIIAKANTHQVCGQISFANVMSIYYKSQTLFAAQAQLTFDLANLVAIDSAAIALMIEWIKLANQNKATLKFIHLPKNLLQFAKTAGIESLLV